MSHSYQTPDIRHTWSGEAHPFVEAMQAGLGFSFQYDGAIIGPQIPRDWMHEIPHEQAPALTRATLKHPSGLQVIRETRVLTDFDAIEYRLHFKNTSSKKLSPVSDIQALYLSFAGPVLHGNSILSSSGGLFDTTLPPNTYALRKRSFSPILDEWSNNFVSEEHLTTEGGHSSNKDFPFFFVHNDACQAGLFVAIGWSGQWWARVFQDPIAKTLNIEGKIPAMRIALEPGEAFTGPTMLVGLYQGTLHDGSNRLRRLVRDHYTPRVKDKKMLPIATYDTFFGGIGVNIDESLLRKLIDAAAELGQEYFLVDNGWFRSDNPASWYEVHGTRFPNGLKPVADYVRAKGMGFGLWFDVENVERHSQLALDHPEWVLWNYDNTSSEWHDMLAKLHKDRGLLDLGLPEVQKWVRELLDHHIREYGIEYIRYDMNIRPLPFWDGNDEPDRRGMRQLGHIHGLYAILDWIRERHPQVILEGCAGGGRRIDLELARRCHVFWISDYTTDPAILKFHLHGIHHFLPGNYHYILYALPSIYQQDFEADDLGFQNLFAGALGLTGRLDLWPEPMRNKARLHVETWKKLRRYLMEDFYPLSPQPADLQSWSGWQFHDPRDNSGFVQTFRTNTPDATHRFMVHKLEAAARYRFTDAYGTDVFEATGLQAMTQGVEFAQPPMSSKVFTYRKA